MANYWNEYGGRRSQSVKEKQKQFEEILLETTVPGKTAAKEVVK